jgi:hypothetical protein
MIDLLLVAIIGGVTWTVAAEGAWGAASIFLSVVLSGLVAMDLFEPVAGMLESAIGSSWAYRVDVIALVGLFAGGVFVLRVLSERLVPSFIAVHPRTYDVGRWGFGLLTGYVTAAFLLAALHTAPLPREFLGFRPERNNLFGLAAPDRQWLGFVQYVSEKSLRSSEDGYVFDGTRFKVPGHESVAVWPTFIIRYASRRENYGAPAGATAQAEPGIKRREVAPAPTTRGRPAGPAGL